MWLRDMRGSVETLTSVLPVTTYSGAADKAAEKRGREGGDDPWIASTVEGEGGGMSVGSR